MTPWQKLSDGQQPFLWSYHFTECCWAVIAWLESMTRLNSSYDFWWLGLDSSHVEKNGDSTRVTFFTEWLVSTRVTVNDSRLESESFLQNLWVPDRQTHLVCTSEMITECRSGLRPEFAFWAGAGAGAGVNILGSNRSRSRSQH